MYSPPSSPSVLASTSRHNIIQPRPHAHEQRQQKSLRLFLGDQSDDDSASDRDFDFGCPSDEDSDADSGYHGSGTSASGSLLRPGPGPCLRSPDRKVARNRAFDDAEEGVSSLFLPRGQAAGATARASPKKASIFATTTAKQQAASSAAIPTTPTKRQKGFVVRGNVTPSRAFSIFKAAKQRSQQRQQHGLLTPPTTSPLRPIILDSHDDSPRSMSSPSKRQQKHRGSHLSSSSPRTFGRSQVSLFESPSRRSLGSSPRQAAPQYKPSAFSTGAGCVSALSESMLSLRTRQGVHSNSSMLGLPRHFSAARTPVFDSTAYLETFVSPASCQLQIPRSADEEVLSHPICAAYSYSSRSVTPSAQWLAVGDDEGRITLLNTLPWQDPTAERFAANPQWQASAAAAIFEVVWRFDDRSLLSGASDFSIRSWDTEYQKCTAEFEGHGGSPRTIVYDPTTNGDGGCGMVFASAGRDGTIRIWDARTSTRGQTPSLDLETDSVGIKPVLTISAAHATGCAPNSTTSKTRKHTRNGAPAAPRGKKRIQQQPVPSGVTALSYLPDGQGHKLLSGGSANGIIKCWDLRHVGQSNANPVAEVDTAMASSGKRGAPPPESTVSAAWETPDLSLLAPSPSVGLGSFRRAHGVSQIVSSSTSLFASCTGGKIYALPLSTFLDSHLTASEVQTLYEPVQCQNTLFSRMALFDDRFLAVGCNTGNIALWDVRLDRSAREAQQVERKAASDLDEERRLARAEQVGFAHSSAHRRGMAVLTEGHQKNTEVNAVAWANGPNGPTLSSVGDDTNVRTWFPDRQLRDSIAHAESAHD